MYFNNFCRYTFVFFLLLNSHQTFAGHSDDENEDAHPKVPIQARPVAIIERENPSGNLIVQSKWDTLSETYTIKAPNCSRFNPGIGSVDISFINKDNSFKISNFTHQDLSKLTVYNPETFSDEELIKKYSLSHYAFSREFGEQQIVRFIKNQLPESTLTLNFLGSSYDNPQFGARILSKQGTEDTPYIDTRLVINSNEDLFFIIEYPYGFNSFSPSERLVLYKNKKLNDALDKGEEIQLVERRTPVLPIFNSSFKKMASNLHPQNYQFVTDPQQKVNQGWGPISIISKGEGHVAVEGDGYVFYQQIPVQDMQSLGGANLMFEADVLSNTPGAYIQYWGYQSPQSPKLMSTPHTGDGSWQRLSLKFTVNGNDKMFFLYPAIMPGLKGLASVPVVEVKNVTLERL